MSGLVFDPNVGTFVSLTTDGRIDPMGDGIWEVEYLRTFYDYVMWEPTSVKGVGRIVGFGTNSSGILEEYKAQGLRIVTHEEPLQGDPINDHYVDLKTMTVQPMAEPTTTLDGTTLRDVPPGSEIVIDDEHRYPVKGKTKKIDLDFDQPGTYRVVVESLTHKDAVFEVVWP